MTEPDLTPAPADALPADVVEAIAKALHDADAKRASDDPRCWQDGPGHREPWLRKAREFAAGAPLLEASLRARIADEVVEFARSGIFTPWGDLEGEVLGLADRIKRGGGTS